jgi:hypothetical protein
MNWKHASLIILLCLGFAANAQDNRLIRLQQACRQFDSALVTKDKVKLNLLLQEYCRIKHSNGLEETKQELLQHLSEGFLEYDEIVQDGEMKVFFDEELGHVNRNLCVKGSLDGKSFSVRLSVAELWSWGYKTHQWTLKSRTGKKTD